MTRVRDPLVRVLLMVLVALQFDQYEQGLAVVLAVLAFYYGYTLWLRSRGRNGIV